MDTVRTPSIIIAGVQKCGTTALYDALCRHEGIEGPAYVFPESSPHAPKELHFFDSTIRRKLGRQWYESHFEPTAARKVEATPEYCISRKNIAEMAAMLPHAHIVLILREPLTRLLSAWQQWSSLPPGNAWPVLRPNGDLLDNVRAEMTSVMDGYHDSNFFGRGLYFRTLRMLRQYYPASRIAVVFLEELVAKPSNVLPALQKWLGLPVKEIPFWPANSGTPGSLRVPAKALERIWRCYQVSNKVLEEMLGRTLPWSKSWMEWVEGGQRYIDMADTTEDPRQRAVSQAMKSWLVVGSKGSAQKAALLKKCKPHNTTLSHQRMCNALGSRLSSDAELEAFLTIPLCANEWVPALRPAIEGGLKPSAAAVRRLGGMIGGGKDELFRLLMANDLEDLVAECWSMKD